MANNLTNMLGGDDFREEARRMKVITDSIDRDARLADKVLRDATRHSERAARESASMLEFARRSSEERGLLQSYVASALRTNLVATGLIAQVNKFASSEQSLIESAAIALTSGIMVRGTSGMSASQPAKSSQAQEKLQKEIISLSVRNQELSETIQSLESKHAEASARANAEEQLRKTIELQFQQQALNHLFLRTPTDSHNRLLEDSSFRNKLLKGTIKAFVMSIDLRRSTELMLKARSPDLFAEFVQAVALSLRTAVLDEYGVFDKFTGDGILAFFPTEFSGEDAGYRVIRAATQCHSAFSTLYRAHRKCFDVILRDIGLGIGIDYGSVNIAIIGDPTVVGTPVVYACRLGAAPAGHTYLNQTAYEVVYEKYHQNLLMEETSLDFKHEGAMVAYDVQLSHVIRIPSKPDWATETIVEPAAPDQPPASEPPHSEVSSSGNA